MSQGFTRDEQAVLYANWKALNNKERREGNLPKTDIAYANYRGLNVEELSHLMLTSAYVDRVRALEATRNSRVSSRLASAGALTLAGARIAQFLPGLMDWISTLM